MLKKLFLFFSLSVLFFFAIFCTGESGINKFDILIKNAKIVDGTGNPWFYGDIGIIGDTIRAVGDLKEAEAQTVIDAKKMMASPGFIDLHTHCEGGLAQEETKANLNYMTQGVTTVVTGNCGQGTLDVAGLKETYARQGLGTNAIHLIGYGQARRQILGLENKAPNYEEIEQIKSLLRKAMDEGAWGMSTGLQYIPGRYATTEELIEMTKVIGEYRGIYSSHMRSEEEQLVEAVKETIRIGEESGVRVNVSHLKASGKPNWNSMNEAIRLMNEARDRGIEVTADMYPYDKSATTPLSIIFNIPPDMEPFSTIQLALALADKEKREQIRKWTEEGDPNKVNWVAKGGWTNFTIISAPKHPEIEGKMFCDLAEEQKRKEFDIAADLFIEEKNDIIISLSTMSEDDVKHAMAQPFVMISSDGSAVRYKEGNVHPRNYGSFTRVLRKYVREEGLIDLEEAVRKMSSLPARLLQLKDRGLILKGYKADLVIFDPQTVRDNATFLNPHQYSSGIEYVIINGQIGIKNGQYAKTLPGRFLSLEEAI